MTAAYDKGYNDCRVNIFWKKNPYKQNENDAEWTRYENGFTECYKYLSNTLSEPEWRKREHDDWEIMEQQQGDQQFLWCEGRR